MQQIMIVEDEHVVALDIRKQVESHGYGVAGVHASAESALASFESSRPDLILMDIRLQGPMDGLKAAEIINRDYGIPVVMLTAYADDATLKRAREAAPFGYIIKPFEERELLTAIVTSLYRHAVERQVVQREQLLKTTLEGIADAVIVTDENERIEYVNTGTRTLLGVDERQSVGAPLSGLFDFRPIPDELAPDADAQDVAAAKTPVYVTGGRERGLITSGDGRTIPVERTMTQRLDPDGTARGWVCVLHDITRRLERDRLVRSQEERLRRSRRMEAIGRLTSGIAHDFNNLLTVIMGYSRLIVDELGEAELPQRETLIEDVDGIRKAAMRSAALTRQLLDFSRSEDAERTVIDVTSELSGMEPIFRQLIKDDINLTIDSEGGPFVVFGDPSQLEQVVMNLVVNARDAMPEGGNLIIKVERRYLALSDVIGREGVEPGDFIVISVSDSGTGMSPETLERVFDPFFTTKEAGQGTGLGLSTVYGIVTKSHGFVDVDTRPGHGTIFSVGLPEHEREDTEGEAVARRADEDTGGETILLVEDDDSIRMLAARILRRKGYSILEAANAGEGLLQAESHSGTIHLLISDIVMPLMSGVKLAARLRENRPELRVILMSGYPDSSLSEPDAMSRGVQFLQKPVDPGTLTREVRRILDG